MKKYFISSFLSLFVIAAAWANMPGTRIPIAGCGGTSTVYLAPGTTTWFVDPCFNVSNNSVITVGAGAGGGGGITSTSGGTGGAGGAYSASTNVTLPAGTTVTVNVPNTTAGRAAGTTTPVTGGDTYICNTLVTNCASLAGSAVVVGAQGGQGATGGATASSVGTTKRAGGNGRQS
jgi:hypothetical protein